MTLTELSLFMGNIVSGLAVVTRQGISDASSSCAAPPSHLPFFPALERGCFHHHTLCVANTL